MHVVLGLTLARSADSMISKEKKIHRISYLQRVRSVSGRCSVRTGKTLDESLTEYIEADLFDQNTVSMTANLCMDPHLQSKRQTIFHTMNLHKSGKLSRCP